MTCRCNASRLAKIAAARERFFRERDAAALRQLGWPYRSNNEALAVYTAFRHRTTCEGFGKRP